MEAMIENPENITARHVYRRAWELADTKTDPMHRLIWTSVGTRTALTLTKPRPLLAPIDNCQLLQGEGSVGIQWAPGGPSTTVAWKP